MTKLAASWYATHVNKQGRSEVCGQEIDHPTQINSPTINFYIFFFSKKK